MQQSHRRRIRAQVAQARRGGRGAGRAPGLRRGRRRPRRAGRDRDRHQPGQARRRRRVDRADAEAATLAASSCMGLDKGPGIEDLAKCLRDGYSTGGSPAPGSARSSACRNTSKSSRGRPGHRSAGALWPDAAARGAAARDRRLVVPKPGETRVRRRLVSSPSAPGGVLVMGVDGLGHGLRAARAAAEACRRLR